MKASRQTSPFEVQLPTADARLLVGPVRGSDVRSQPDPEAMKDALEYNFFSLGVRVGAAIQGLFVCALVMYVSDDPDTGAIVELSARYYAVFRWLLVMSLFFVCYAVDLFVWHRFKINYQSILVVTPEHNYQYMIRASTAVMLILFPSFILYVSCLLTSEEAMNMRKFVPPLIAVSAFLLFLLNPFGTGAAQRYGMIRIIATVCVSPFSEMNFARVFAADVLTSMPKVFSDVEYTACLYITGEAFAGGWNRETLQYDTDTSCELSHHHDMNRFIIKVALSVFPFWIRFMQCMRYFKDTRSPKHVFNGFKYLSSIAVIALSFQSDKYIWLAAALFSTLFGFTWDILMDWGLGPASIRRAVHGEGFGQPSPSSWLLRPICLYPRWAYYVASCTNFFARFGWAVVVSPGQTVLRQHVVLLLSCVEVLRRTQWALLRLEWEDVHRTFGKEPAKLSPELSCLAGRHTFPCHPTSTWSRQTTQTTQDTEGQC
jgi:hypothetical protein